MLHATLELTELEGRAMKWPSIGICLCAVLAATSGCSGEPGANDSSGGGAKAEDSQSGGAASRGNGVATGGTGSATGGASTSGSGAAGTGGAAAGSGASPAGGSGAGNDAVPSSTACAAVADWPNDQAAKEEEVLALVNQHRSDGATCGGQGKPTVPPLTMDPYLRCAARLHSRDMADRDFFSHATWNGSSDECTDNSSCSNGQLCAGRNPTSTPMRCGKSPATRVSEIEGPSGAGWENIAAGNDSAAATVQQWMNSTGHCNNIMSGALKTLGVGYARGPGEWNHYWTQSFND